MPDLAPPQHTPWVLLLPTGGVRAGAYASSPGAAPDNLLPARPACGTRPCVGVAEWGRVWRPASGPIADSADLAPQLQHVCCSLPDRAPMRHRETRTRTGRRSSGACRSAGNGLQLSSAACDPGKSWPPGGAHRTGEVAGSSAQISSEGRSACGSQTPRSSCSECHSKWAAPRYRAVTLRWGRAVGIGSLGLAPFWGRELSGHDPRASGRWSPSQ